MNGPHYLGFQARWVCVLTLRAAEPLGAHEQEDDMISLASSIFSFCFFLFFFSLAEKVTLVPSWKMDWKETEDRPSLAAMALSCGEKIQGQNQWDEDKDRESSLKGMSSSGKLNSRGSQTRTFGTDRDYAGRPLSGDTIEESSFPFCGTSSICLNSGLGNQPFGSRHEEMLQKPYSWPASVPMLAGAEKGKGDSHALYLATVGLLYGNLPSQGPHCAEHLKNDPKNTREGYHHRQKGQEHLACMQVPLLSFLNPLECLYCDINCNI